MPRRQRDPDFDEFYRTLRENWMQSFVAACRIELQFESPTARPDFDFWWVIHLQGKLQVGDAAASFSEDSDGLQLRIDNVRAVDCYEAFDRAQILIETALAAMSLAIQREYEEQYRGHVRLTWRSDEVVIEPWESMLPGKGAVGSARWMDASEAQSYVNGITAFPELRMLLSSYYDSLAPVSPAAKFYAAFAVVEYAEKRFSDSAEAVLLSDAQFIAVVNTVSETLVASEVEAKTVERVVNFVSELRSRTLRNRRDKLVSILRNQIRLTELKLSDAETVTVDASLIGDILEARHRLVHAPSTSSEKRALKRLSDAVVLVAQAVLDNVLGDPS